MKLIAALVLALVASVQAANWAVLVAGSNGYYNYRHQSDICHAFQILTVKGGIPRDHVIVFMYDDIANNAQNPFKGTIINAPNGPNVYVNVNKDYIGAAVTPTNFIAAITGTGTAGPVLKSGPNDQVFMYFSDHGAAGLVAFPSGYLYATDLIHALQTMNTKKMYQKLVFYIEACESGSMFENILPANLNIFGTTASTASQSSYACYWDAKRNAYLGDEYSVRWMEDSDEHDTVTPGGWTLEDQFKIVGKETVMSQPQQYGTMAMQTDDITVYQSINHKTAQTRALRSMKYTPCSGASSRDVKLATLQHMYEAASGANKLDLANQIQAELADRARWDHVTDSIMAEVAGPVAVAHLKTVRHQPTNFECLKASVEGVEAVCGKFTDYSLKHVYTLANMCEEGKAASAIVAAAAHVCGH